MMACVLEISEIRGGVLIVSLEEKEAP